MRLQFKVYEKKGADLPIVSLSELPTYQITEKRKFVGKKAKMEAISRYLAISLPIEFTTEQVDAYISENLFNTPMWSGYHKVFKIVANEKIIVSNDLMLKYTADVEVKDDFKDNMKLYEKELVYLVTCELMGDHQDEYRGLRNPIVSIKKNE